MDTLILAAVLETQNEEFKDAYLSELTELQLALIGGGSADVFCQ